MNKDEADAKQERRSLVNSRHNVLNNISPRTFYSSKQRRPFVFCGVAFFNLAGRVTRGRENKYSANRTLHVHILQFVTFLSFAAQDFSVLRAFSTAIERLKMTITKAVEIFDIRPKGVN